MPDTAATSAGSGKGVDDRADHLVAGIDQLRGDAGVGLGLLQLEQGVDDAGLTVGLACLRHLRGGILRAHQVSPNGTLRDTAVYSITAAEWPTVRAHLDWQLAKPR